MKAAGSVLTAAVILLLGGVTFLLGAINGHDDDAGCGTVTAANIETENVAGYQGDQLVNAATIMSTATALGLGPRGQMLGVMAAMGESSLRNLTYGDWETSGATNPNGTRTTSIGLFQQQESWGTVAERLDPATSAMLFFQRLARVTGWETLPASEAIHRVQINTDPDHYTKWETAAQTVTTALSITCDTTAVATGGGAAGAWGGYENGRIPTSQLAAVPWDRDNLLRADAARALVLLNASFRQTFGYDLPLNDAYRDYDGQVQAKAMYGDEAADIGTSVHGWALAIDVGTFSHARIGFDSATYAWLKTHAAAHGWVHPDWAEPGGNGPDEAWHWEYNSPT